MADEKPSYEQARAELAEVVARLESGGVPLAESMQLWKRGEELAAYCQAELDGARRLIDEARRTAQPDGGRPDDEPAAQDG
ncbi:exodeoxyribonuclease VII small subunit [Propionibacterium acidifaciens]|nr:exodeoxyribonuclease VII small subunit [Propionibacterium acidifaciens]AYW77286.1 exodeoxyribonuclease VII small subunit [Propionibacterium acidifaciens]